MAKIDNKPDRSMRKSVLLYMLLSGGVMALAFPPFSLWPVAWIGLVPLLLAVRNARIRDAAWAGFFFNAGFIGVMGSWCLVFGFVPWALLIMLCAPVPVLFGAGAAVIHRSRFFWLQLMVVPALWTAVEWLRSLGAYGCTASMLAASQVNNPAFIQLAAWTGSWGLTYVPALFGAALVVERNRREAAVAVAVFAALLHVWGASCLRQQLPGSEPLKVALVQGAIAPELHGVNEENRAAKIREHKLRTIRTYHSLTIEAALEKPDIMVWPESVVPGDVVSDPSVRRWIGDVARKTQAYMLVGAAHDVRPDPSGPSRPMNGAHIFSPQGELLGSYYKVRLVPFAEFVPGRRLYTLLGRRPFRENDVLAAREHKLIPTPIGKIGSVICFESVFPGTARREIRDGAEILFVLTNDGWFKRTAATAQHFNHCILRAVENRRYVVRSGSTGVSCIVDPYGRVTSRLDIWERGVACGEVRPLKDLSFYSRFGDWFAYLCVLLGIVGIAAGAARRR